MLTAVSLFAGIGGIDLALEHVGVHVAAAVEIDPAARGVLVEHFPTTTLFEDVCEVTGDQLVAAGFVPERGILAAGWPCQDLSVAGRRLGLGGARSGLFWEVVRILAELRPRWFLLENVPGLLSAVCSCPGDGYCGGWATSDEWDNETFHPCDAPHPLRGGACGWDGTRGYCMDLHGGTMGAVVGSLAELGYGLCWRVLDAQHFGVPQRRRRVVFVGCLGDGAAPVQVLLEPEGGGGDPAPSREAGPDTAGVGALRASVGGADDNDAQGGRLIVAPVWASNHHGDHAAAESHIVVGPLQAEGADGRGHRIDAEGAANGHLVAATLTAGSHASRTLGRRREDDENIVVAPTLTNHHDRNTPDQELLLAVPFDAPQITSRENRSNPRPVALATAVRRLTPVECERLQGFPDGWTVTSGRQRQSDSARYRQLGNSVAVPVFDWVGRRIVAVDANWGGSR